MSIKLGRSVVDRRQWSDEELLATSLAELLSAARSARDGAFGNRITYSPKVFIPLTRLCRDTCGYCTFATAPALVPSPYLSIDEVLAIDRKSVV